MELLFLTQLQLIHNYQNPLRKKKSIITNIELSNSFPKALLQSVFRSEISVKQIAVPLSAPQMLLSETQSL